MCSSDLLYGRGKKKRGVDYWKGWVDGVYDNTSGWQVGFYWSLESPYQTINDRYLTKIELDTISNYVKTSRSQVLHWIPALGSALCCMKPTETIDQVLDATAITTIYGDFNLVFCQPNYYQNAEIARDPTSKCSKTNRCNQLNYTYDRLLDVIKWIWNATSNTYIELEADRGVLGTPENCRCEIGTCCVDYACKYVQAQKDVTDSVWAQRAYYFSTEVAVIDTVRNQCSDW